MHIELQLLNASGDELGRLPMQTICVAAAGVSTVAPDLKGEMMQMTERIILALAQEGMASNLDPIDLRLAVGRALLAPVADLVRIPVPVCPLDEGYDNHWNENVR